MPERWTESSFIMHQASWSYSHIPADMHIVTIVHRIWTRWIKERNVNHCERPSPLRHSTECSDQRIQRDTVAALQSSTFSLSAFCGMCRELWIFQSGKTASTQVNLWEHCHSFQLADMNDCVGTKPLRWLNSTVWCSVTSLGSVCLKATAG